MINSTKLKPSEWFFLKEMIRGLKNNKGDGHLIHPKILFPSRLVSPECLPIYDWRPPHNRSVLLLRHSFHFPHNHRSDPGRFDFPIKHTASTRCDPRHTSNNKPC